MFTQNCMLRTSRTTSRWHSTQKVWTTKNFLKPKWPEGSIYSGAFLIKMQNSWKWSHRNRKISFLVNISENIQKIYFFGSCFFNLNFFEVLLNNVIMSFMIFLYIAETSIIRFFLQLLNISVISKATILICVVNLPLWYKFHKKEILNKPPGEPREQHLGDTKSLSYTKFHKRRKYWKGRYILAHFWGQLHLASKFQNI